MDTRRLEIFLKLLDTRSFSKTAKALGITQPSVSASIKALEESLGQKLFERTPRQVDPLPAADILAPYAAEIIQTAGRAAWAVSRQLINPREMLSIGASSVPALVFLPKALSIFSEKYPNILIKLKAGHSRDIAERVVEGELDLALAGMQPKQDELSRVALGRDSLLLLCSASEAAARRKGPRTVEELLNWPLILREEGSGTREALMSALGGQSGNLSGRLNIRAEVQGFAPAVALTKASFGATVVSNLVPQAINMDGLKTFDLKFLGSRQFYMLRRKAAQASPALDALAEIIKANFQVKG